jgi:hypothetical protein
LLLREDVMSVFRALILLLLLLFVRVILLHEIVHVVISMLL